MAQIDSKRTFISHDEGGAYLYSINKLPSSVILNNISNTEFGNLLLVPAMGNHNVYEIEDDSQILNIDFIVNTDLFDYILINHSVGSNHRESIFKISELTEHDGMVTVPLDPSSWRIYSGEQAESVEAHAWLVNKVIVESEPNPTEYYEDYNIPCVFYVLNKAAAPVGIWRQDPEDDFIVFNQVDWLFPLCIISSSSEKSPYYCVSQGDVTAGVD